MKMYVSRGTLKLLVLTLLKNNLQDMYIYEIYKVVKNSIDVTYASVTSVLEDLIKENCVSAHKEIVKSRPRLYYHLKPAGLKLLYEMRADYIEHQRNVNYLLNI